MASILFTKASSNIDVPKREVTLSPGNTEGLGLLTRQAYKILAKPAIIIPSPIPTISDFTTAAWVQALNNRTASITIYGSSELGA